MDITILYIILLTNFAIPRTFVPVRGRCFLLLYLHQDCLNPANSNRVVSYGAPCAGTVGTLGACCANGIIWPAPALSFSALHTPAFTQPPSLPGMFWPLKDLSPEQLRICYVFLFPNPFPYFLLVIGEASVRQALCVA